MSSIIQCAAREDGEHILLDDAEGRHQIWLVKGEQTSGRAFVIPIDENFAARLDSVRRLHRHLNGLQAGPRLRSLRLSRTQRARLALLVRALDGQRSGVPRREIAAVLLDAEARNIPAIEWKNDALRKRINRILSRATSFVNGGYLVLLRGDPARAGRFRSSL